MHPGLDEDDKVLGKRDDVGWELQSLEAMGNVLVNEVVLDFSNLVANGFMCLPFAY